MELKANEKICEKRPFSLTVCPTLMTNSKNSVISEWINQSMSAGTNELQMIVCFSPNLIHSKYCQPNEDCC